jgi:hypothetical protein
MDRLDGMSEQEADWYTALVLCALEQTGNDLGAALEVADTALHEHPDQYARGGWLVPLQYGWEDMGLYNGGPKHRYKGTPPDKGNRYQNTPPGSRGKGKETAPAAPKPAPQPKAPRAPKKPPAPTALDMHAYLSSLDPGSMDNAAMGELAEKLASMTSADRANLKRSLGVRVNAPVSVLGQAVLAKARELVAAGGKSPEPIPTGRPQPKPPEPGFTGVDSLGHHWQDGKLVPDKEKPKPEKKPADKKSRKLTPQESRGLRQVLQGADISKAEAFAQKLEGMSDAHAQHAWINSGLKLKGVKQFDPKTGAEAAEALRHTVAYHAWVAEKVPSGKEREAAIRAFPHLAHLGDKLAIRDLDSLEAKKHIYHLSLLPETALKSLAENGLKGIYVGSVPMTQLDHNQKMAGMRPRGWDEGDTWDMVAGCYNHWKKEVTAGVGQEGTTSLLLHETGHSYGDVLGWNADAGLKTHHERLHPKLQKYLQQGGPGGRVGCEELLAESIADYYIKGRAGAVETYDEGYISWLEQGPLAGQKAGGQYASTAAKERQSADTQTGGSGRDTGRRDGGDRTGQSGVQGVAGRPGATGGGGEDDSGNLSPQSDLPRSWRR